jgi:hypothetical protein
MIHRIYTPLFNYFSNVIQTDIRILEFGYSSSKGFGGRSFLAFHKNHINKEITIDILFLRFTLRKKVKK